MKRWAIISAFALAPVPWLFIRFSGELPDPWLTSLLAGFSIFAAAFLLSWAAEVVQIDISQSLALALVALIAVLPEYSVDMYFAWKAGKDPVYAHYAIANMTGGNRLLVGLGWSSVVLVYWLKFKEKAVVLDKDQSMEIAFLILPSVYCFVIPIKGSISVVDAAVLISIFVFYIRAAGRAKRVEPELVGPPVAIALLNRPIRRTVTALMFLYSAFVIIASAEPFAEGLVHTGKNLGIDEFILVQWIAPLASESPEFIVAAIFAYRGSPGLALCTLISSKINQWTLLVGFIPVVYSASLGEIAPIPMDFRQVEEVALTAAQSLFALVLLSNLRMSFLEALVLMVLFVTQLFILHPTARLVFSGIYLVLAIALLIADSTRRKNIVMFMSDLKGYVR